MSLKKLQFLLFIFIVFQTTNACTKKDTSLAQIQIPSEQISEEDIQLPFDEKRAKFTPMEAIKDLDQKLESYQTRSTLTAEETEQNKRLKKEIIQGTFDIKELSRLALDTHWDTLPDKERREFTHLMTSLLERKAIFSKEQVKGNDKPYKIVYKGEKYLDAAKQKSLVFNTIFVPSEKIDLDIKYELIYTPTGWKIYDVIVDEASLVENYKFQFDTIIRKNGYSNLKERMQKKLKEMD